MDVSIVVSTFGNYKWQLLAQERALPSASSFDVPVIYNHGKTLHEARNLGLSQVETEYVCYLDADDILAPGYFDEIEKVEGDIRVPAVSYYPNPSKMPNVVGHTHSCNAYCLDEGNWIVVGAVAKVELLKKVGGWKNYEVFEDYDLWQRCWIVGASIVPVPKATYIAYSTPQGRNKAMPVEKSRAIQKLICETNLPERNWDWLK